MEVHSSPFKSWPEVLRRVGKSVPLLLAVGCSSADPQTKVAEWKDHQLETFDIEVKSTRDRIEKIPYGVLDLISGEEVNLDTDGNENFSLGIHESSAVSDWKFDKDDLAIYVTNEWWCGTALPWLNVYTNIIAQDDFFVKDTETCEVKTYPQNYTIEELQGMYDEALAALTEEDTDDVEEVPADTGTY